MEKNNKYIPINHHVTIWQAPPNIMGFTGQVKKKHVLKTVQKARRLISCYFTEDKIVS